MTDVLDRLRQADPCPHEVRYPAEQIEQRISAIVSRREDAAVVAGDELDAHFLGGFPPPRPGRSRTLLVAGVTALLVAGLAAGLAIGLPRNAAKPSAPTTSSPSVGKWVRYSSDGISFDRPAAWAPYPAQVPASTVSLVVAYLATKALPAPCVTSVAPGGEVVSTACGPPPIDLTHGGVFIDWTILSMPVPNLLADQPGTPTTIAGRPARLNTSAVPHECDRTGASHGVSAAISLPPPADSSVLTMTACLGDADPAAATADVQHMLNSLTIAPG